MTDLGWFVTVVSEVPSASAFRSSEAAAAYDFYSSATEGIFKRCLVSAGSGTYGGLAYFSATARQSTPSKNLWRMMSRISSRTFGSATRIFRTTSRVSGVRFLGRTIRPALTVSIMCWGGIATIPPRLPPPNPSWDDPISMALGPNGVKPPSISQIKIPKLHISAL